MNMVYQSTDQLRQMPLLSIENPPVVYGIELKGLNANDDGLYRLTDFEQRFTERIEAYDATPSSIRSTKYGDSATSSKVTASGDSGSTRARNMLRHMHPEMVRRW